MLRVAVDNAVIEWEGGAVWSGDPGLLGLLETFRRTRPTVLVTPTGPEVRYAADDPRTVIGALQGLSFGRVRWTGELPEWPYGTDEDEDDRAVH